MLQIKTALVFLALTVPFSISWGDDEETQQLHSNSYQLYASTSCTYQGDCALFFPATTHINTAITNVSCNFVVPSGTSITSAVLGTEAFTGRFFVQPFLFGYSDGNATYGINSVTNLFVPKGGIPRIDVYTQGGVILDLFCTISGYHS